MPSSRPLSGGEKGAYAAAIAGGALLWIATAALSGRTEAWDAPLYWKAAYPLALVLAAVLGYLQPRQPWRWALAVFLAQPAVLAFSASGFGLLPLGLILFAVLALPAVALAGIAARFSPRRADGA